MELYLLCIRWMKRYCKPAALFQEYKFLYDIFGYLWCWHLDIFNYFWCHLNFFGVIWIFVVAFWYFWWHLDICGCGVMREGGEPAAGSANIGVFVRLCLAFVHLQRKLQEHLWNCASGKYSQLWTKWYRKNMLTQLFWSEGLHWETEHLFTTVRRPYAATLLSYNLSKVFFGINLNSFMRKPVSLSSTLQHITFCYCKFEFGPLATFSDFMYHQFLSFYSSLFELYATLSVYYCQAL